MQKLKRKAIDLMRQLKSALGPRHVKVVFAGHELTLDTRWRHERDYYDYVNGATICGPLAMDVWAFSHFIKAGDTVLDAGANLGFTSLLAEKAGAGEVHSFEPDPRLVERLNAHCHGGKIVVHAKALGDRPGSLQLCLSTAHNQGSTLSDRMVGKFPKVFAGSQFVDVEIVSIDDFFKDKHFNFIKIDVEGAEAATLRGASLMFQSSRPEYVYIEVYDEFHDEVHEILKASYPFSYRIACDHNAHCKLFPLETDFSQLAGLYVMPPSYIYSASSQEELTNRWTRPAFAGETA